MFIIMQKPSEYLARYSIIQFYSCNLYLIKKIESPLYKKFKTTQMFVQQYLKTTLIKLCREL